MSFSPDGERYVTVADDGRLRVWDRESGALVAVSEDGGRPFGSFHEGTAVFTPDGEAVWTGTSLDMILDKYDAAVRNLRP